MKTGYASSENNADMSVYFYSWFIYRPYEAILWN